MGIMAKKTGSTFLPHPEGQFAVVCCDVVDLGNVKVEYGGKVKEQHKIWIVFQSDEGHPETQEPMTVRERFTLSLHEKAVLRKFCEAWRGKPYTEDQARQGVDIEAMIGVSALIQVVHREKAGNTYANISSVMRLPKGTPAPAINPKYVRVKDRPRDNGKAISADYPDQNPEDDGDDDLPF